MTFLCIADLDLNITLIFSELVFLTVGGRKNAHREAPTFAAKKLQCSLQCNDYASCRFAPMLG